MNHTLIGRILVFLVAFDLILSIWGFFFPGLWYAFFHGADYVDPQGLLRRCAANWTGFLIIQIIALIKWKKSPWWLLVVAGARLGDSLTDITCLIFSSNISIFGILGFPMAGAGNVIIGIYLIRGYVKSMGNGESSG